MCLWHFFALNRPIKAYGMEYNMTWILLGVIAIAYAATWYFVLRSRNIIEKISKSEYKNSRDIVNNLKL